MDLCKRKLSAVTLARFVRQNFFGINRGAFRCRSAKNAGDALAVFGNDHYSTNPGVRRDVARVRKQLQEAETEELGFALSDDGCSWALLVRPAERHETAVGQSFYVSMVQELLQDFVKESTDKKRKRKPETNC